VDVNNAFEDVFGRAYQINEIFVNDNNALPPSLSGDRKQEILFCWP